MARLRLPASSQRSAALLENTTVNYSEARFRGPDEGNDSLGDRLSYQCPAAAAAATLKQVNKWSNWSGGKEDVEGRWRGGRWEELERQGSKKRAPRGPTRKREVTGWRVGGLDGGGVVVVRPPRCLLACT